MTKPVERPGVQAGYDQWSSTYDDTANPLVALDKRYTCGLLAPNPGERILDAGCGTGRNVAWLTWAGARPVGLDHSRGMLAVARRKLPHVPLVCADLDRPLPLAAGQFDAVLCALVGEHLREPAWFFAEAHATLRPGGRIVFSVFHPELAAAGIEANFERDGVEVRLGAELHTVADYLDAAGAAGFTEIQHDELWGDEKLVRVIPNGGKYLDRNLLLVITAHRS